MMMDMHDAVTSKDDVALAHVMKSVTPTSWNAFLRTLRPVGNIEIHPHFHQDCYSRLLRSGLLTLSEVDQFSFRWRAVYAVQTYRNELKVMLEQVLGVANVGEVVLSFL